MKCEVRGSGDGEKNCQFLMVELMGFADGLNEV